VLEIDVAFTPRLLARTRRPPVVVLVDVLRATSTATTLFALGARGLEVARGLDQARARAEVDRLVCAERASGRQAHGTDLPISPARLTAAAVAGRDVVLCTTNGTRALRRVAPRACQVLLGCLLNASAVAEAGLALR
jgi:2-phosphosulfolactate phosphatase